MAEVRLSPVAQADFDEILDHLVVVAGNQVAANYAERLQAVANRLAAFPGLGTPHRHLGSATRVVSVDPYLIFYDGGRGAGQ
jgi:plasmid stabilization system protein ParE